MPELPQMQALAERLHEVLVGRVLAGDDWDLLYRLAAAVPGGSLILRYWHRAVKLNW